MNTILITLLLIFSLPTLAWTQTSLWNPFVLPVRTLEDAFQRCEMDIETIQFISISDSSGQFISVDVNQVLETEVLDVVDLSETSVWFETLPSDTRLIGIGLIIYEEDIVTNRDSFLLFFNASQEEHWWFALFRQNIFLAPRGQLQTWISDEANFCDLFEIALSYGSEKPSEVAAI